MNKEIRTEIEISAPASKVWSVLTDFARFPEWNPFVVRVDGEPRAGRELKIDVQLPESRMLKFTPVVLRAEADRELRWVGKLPLGAFRGEHFYMIEPIDESSIRFIHGELFSGWLVGVVWRVHGERIERGYGLMNEALKRRAEEA